jgi:hypothetical protein
VIRLAGGGIAAALLLCPVLVSAQKTAGEIPVEAFFRRAQFAQMELSPDATRLAAIVPRSGRDNLIVIDLASRKANVMTAFDGFDVASFRWVSNTRLCYDVADGLEATGEPRYRGNACADHDGDKYRRGAFGRVFALAHDGSGDVFFVSGRSSNVQLRRGSTASGRSDLISAEGPG